MSRKRAQALWVVALVAAAVALVVSGVVTRGDKKWPANTCTVGDYFDGTGCTPIRGFSTGPTAAGECPSHPCVGDTATAETEGWIDTALATKFIDLSASELCATTISGASWVQQNYPAGHWRQGINQLKFAHAFSEDKADYDLAYDTLVLTTVSGKKYCAARSHYPGGKWEAGFGFIATARAYAVAHPEKVGPAIAITVPAS